MATALLITSLATSVIGAGVSYVQQKRAAKAQESAAEYNFKVQQQQARQTEDVSAANFSKLQRDKRQRLASARARAAGSGVSFTGSVLESHAAGARKLEEDIQSQVYNAASSARAQRNQAKMGLWEGKQQAQATRTNANASLLSSVGSIASSGYTGVQNGSIPTRLN